MKKKLLSTILSLTLVFSLNQMAMVSATNYDDEATTFPENGGPATMLPDENDMPDVDDGVDNDMSEQGGPSTMLPDENEVPEVDYGVDNDMSEQGEEKPATPDTGTTFPETGEERPATPDTGMTFPETENNGPTSVPSTGVTMLAQLF